MNKLELINNIKDLYDNEYFVGFTKGIFVNNSVLLKYKYSDMYTEKVGIAIVLEDNDTITIIDWFKDNLTKDIVNKLMNYFKLLGYTVTKR